MPGRIDIVGLGPGHPLLRTAGTQALLDGATAIILRTGVHPGLEDLHDDPRVSTCDDLYQTVSEFAEVYEAIVNRLIEAADGSDVVYAVPGHPMFGERSVHRILELARGREIDVIIHSAVSALDVVATSTAVDPIADGLQIVDAETLDSIWEHGPFSGGWLSIDPTRPCLIGQVFSRQFASHVKLTLSRVYPENHMVLVVTAAGIEAEESVVECPLFELDHQPVDHLTSVVIPPLDPLETHRTANTVQRLVAYLRSPNGCPWDRKQSHLSLRAAVIEEAYEVVDAINESDPHHLAEELGDLLLLIAMHAQIADEEGDFALEDVYDAISRKLIRRHPHVFGDLRVSTPDEVVTTWEGVKQAERERAGKPDDGSGRHPIDRFPRSMPAMIRIEQVLGKNGQRRLPGEVSSDQLAHNLFDALEAVISAGLDPESELLSVARERLADDNGVISTGAESQNS